MMNFGPPNPKKGQNINANDSARLRGDLSDEDERDELDELNTHDMDEEEVLYGGDESDFDKEYYDNEDEWDDVGPY
jgi:hypothetical protein